MINQSNIFKKIGHILNELQDQYQFLSENPEQLSELELELFLANANFLSDHVEIVRKLNNNKPVKQLQEPVGESVNEVEQPKVETNEPAAEANHNEDTMSHSEPVSIEEEGPLIEQIEREELHQDDLPSTFEFIIDKDPASDRTEFEEKKHNEDLFDGTSSKKDEPIIAYNKESDDRLSVPVTNDEHLRGQEVEPIVKPEYTTQPQPAVIPSKQPQVAAEVREIPQPQPAFVRDKVEEKQVPAASADLVADKIEDKVLSQPTAFQRPTLNDLLAGNKMPNKPEETTKPAITDLKRSITLNEKLLYIKDLFNGYNLAYSEAIDLINKMPDLKSADAFLKNNYAIKNNWEAKQTTVAQFYDLLKQRFPEG